MNEMTCESRYTLIGGQLKMTTYEIVEIGTSDFDTEIEKFCGDTVAKLLAVEPNPVSFRKLATTKYSMKLNAAVSDTAGNMTLKYLHEEMREKLGLRKWVDGCISLSGPHPTMLNAIRGALKRFGSKAAPESMLSTAVARVCTFEQLAEEAGMLWIGHLKIDTEGHDPKVLKSLCNWIDQGGGRPLSIRFESNKLTPPGLYTETLRRMIDYGYHIVTENYYPSLGAVDDTDLLLNIPTYRRKVVSVEELTSPEDYPHRFIGTYIVGHPQGYDPRKLPHDNNWKDAMEYAITLKNSGEDAIGVTYENGMYTVRAGPYAPYMMYMKGMENPSVSWLVVR